jgi:hypothetical protein
MRASSLPLRGRSAVRAALSPTTLRVAAVEAAWTATHVALYPLGLRRAGRRAEDMPIRLETLPLRQRGLVAGDIEAAGTPILLVHGMIDNRSIFTLLRRGLRRRGFWQLPAMNYSPFTTDVRAAAVRLAERVEQIVAETGYDRIHIVGHSLGGLIARYNVQRLGGHQRVHTLVTLGSPHGGTLAAHLLPHPLVRQLRPGADLIRELAEPAPECGTRFVAFYSDLDHVVVPSSNGAVHHPDLDARNILIPGTGHLSFPLNGKVVHEITQILARLARDGESLTVREADSGGAA